MKLRKQILVAIVCITIGAAMIGGGTFAYFSATATSAGNTFAMGELKFGTTPLAPVALGPMNPGSTGTQNYSLVNGGNLKIGHLYLKCNYTAPDIGLPNGGKDLGTQLAIDSIKFKGQTIAKPNGVATLADLKAYTQDTTKSLIDLGWIDVGTASAPLEIKLTFTNDPNNSQDQYQNEIATIAYSLEARTE